MITFEPPLYLDDCSVLYLGRWGFGGANVEEHLHGGFYELTMITRGSGKIYTGNVPENVKKGDVYISFPFDIHKIESDENDPLGYDFISFTVNSFKFAKQLNKLWSDNIAPDMRVINDEKALVLIDAILSEFDGDKNEKPFSNELISALINQLIVFVLRGLSEKPASDTVINQGNSELCMRMMNYIDEHLYTMKSLDEISKALGYNYSYLSALFRKTTTTSLSYYYRAKRLETSRLFLAENKMSISQIAEIMNYSSVYAFSKSFKEHYGISPRQYLSQIPRKSEKKDEKR